MWNLPLFSCDFNSLGKPQAPNVWVLRLGREAKGDTLASQFNRRQPIIRKVLDTVEARLETWECYARPASQPDRLLNELAPAPLLDLAAAGRLAVVGMFQARSHPEWELSKNLPVSSSAHAFLSELSDTSVTTIYHAVRQLRYGMTPDHPIAHSPCARNSDEIPF
jgi:hypothetical protein